MRKSLRKYSAMQIVTGIEEHIKSLDMPKPRRNKDQLEIYFGEGENKREYLLEVVCGRNSASLLLHLEEPPESAFDLLKERMVPNKENGRISGQKPDEQAGYNCFFHFLDLRKSELTYGEKKIPTIVYVNRIKRIPQRSTSAGEINDSLKLFGESSFNYVIKPFIRSVEYYSKRK